MALTACSSGASAAAPLAANLLRLERLAAALGEDTERIAAHEPHGPQHHGAQRDIVVRHVDGPGKPLLQPCSSTLCCVPLEV